MKSRVKFTHASLSLRQTQRQQSDAAVVQLKPQGQTCRCEVRLKSALPCSFRRASVLHSLHALLKWTCEILSTLCSIIPLLHYIPQGNNALFPQTHSLNMLPFIKLWSADSPDLLVVVWSITVNLKSAVFCIAGQLGSLSLRWLDRVTASLTNINAGFYCKRLHSRLAQSHFQSLPLPLVFQGGPSPLRNNLSVTRNSGWNRQLLSKTIPQDPSDVLSRGGWRLCSQIWTFPTCHIWLWRYPLSLAILILSQYHMPCI